MAPLFMERPTSKIAYLYALYRTEYTEDWDCALGSKFYDMYEVLNRCVFKLVLNFSYVSIFLTCSGRLFHNTGAAYENYLSP